MDKENIVYKIIGLKNRKGSNYNLVFGRRHKSQGFREWRKTNILLWKVIKDYFPTYKKGSMIESVQGSPGIMCFETKQFAENFVVSQNFKIFGIKYEIIKVKGLGSRKIRPWVTSNCGTYLERVNKYSYNMKAPDGTVTFESVEVLQ